MPLTKGEVQHIAALCRIGMTEDDLEGMPEELSHILELFQALEGLDTEGVSPTGYSVAQETVMRADEPRPSSPTEDVLANAPRREGDLFRVNVVLEE